MGTQCSTVLTHKPPFCSRQASGETKLFQTASEHAQTSILNLRRDHKPEHLTPPLEKQKASCQYSVWCFLQDWEKTHKLKNSATRGKQEVWNRDIHRRFEKSSESLVGLTEGISLWKSVGKDWRSQQCKTSRNMKKLGKCDTVKELQ